MACSLTRTTVLLTLLLVPVTLAGAPAGGRLHERGFGFDNLVLVQRYPIEASHPYTFFYNDPLKQEHILRWGKGGTGFEVPPEEARFRIDHRAGVVTSMMRDKADWNNGSQFMIMVAHDPELDRRHTPFAKVVDNLEDGMRDADVVMALRIQRERIEDLDGIPGADEYFANFGVSLDRMKLAKRDAIVMHPGPMNRGIEIEGTLADGPQSRITRQVTNGVAVRMAVLERVARTLDAQ